MKYFRKLVTYLSQHPQFQYPETIFPRGKEFWPTLPGIGNVAFEKCLSQEQRDCAQVQTILDLAFFHSSKLVYPSQPFDVSGDLFSASAVSIRGCTCNQTGHIDTNLNAQVSHLKVVLGRGKPPEQSTFSKRLISPVSLSLSLALCFYKVNSRDVSDAKAPSGSCPYNRPNSIRYIRFDFQTFDETRSRCWSCKFLEYTEKKIHFSYHFR